MTQTNSEIWISGSGGFIGKALVSLGHNGGSHNALFDGTGPDEDVRTIIHTGRDPGLGSGCYDIEDDIELKIACFARERDLNFVMLSTRKVYGDLPSPIHEDSVCTPKDRYGQQKLAMERRLQDILGDRLTILRLSNVFGYEPGRMTFMGAMLDSLRRTGEICFDMSPQTARDFIPIEMAAEAISAIAEDPPARIVNVGSGINIPTGDLAKAVIAGFCDGRLTITDYSIRDAFVLDVSRMLEITGIQTSRFEVIKVALAIGSELRAKTPRSTLITY